MDKMDNNARVYRFEDLIEITADSLRSTTSTIKTKDLALVNMLRRSIKQEITTWTIDLVSFDINTSSRHDELLAHRLGLIPIDCEEFNPVEHGTRHHLDVQASENELYEVTTDDLPDIPWAKMDGVYGVTPIITLRHGERIVCDVIVMDGVGYTHVKWRPVSKVQIRDREDGFYDMTIVKKGVLSGERTFREGFANIPNAMARPAGTKLTKAVMPEKY
jgi:DNA-directed RNA polymerase alpha subunit